MIPTPLMPGDLLLYRPSSLFGRLISIKSWSRYSHCEVAVSPGKSFSARADGVRYNPTRWDHLACVMRPDPARLDMTAGLKWFNEKAHGQAYDYYGILRFFTIGKQSMDKQFCSEVATRFYRNAGFPDLFHAQDADLVPPGWFATMAPEFSLVWSDNNV
jgi:hypothetical protein